MNFFEQELRKLFENHPVIEDVRFPGRVAVGRLSGNTSVKLQFVTLGYADRYEGIEATVLNRGEGKIDSAIFRFADILGRKQVSNPNFKEGVLPHVYKGNKDFEWYVYKPSPADYEKLSDSIGEYLEIFQEPIQSQGMSQQMR
jgi:hypothetical protein